MKIDELIKQWKKSHSEALRALILAMDPLGELQGLESLRIAQVVEKLEPYAKPLRADDPRVTRALEPIIDLVTWSSDGSKPAWRAIFAVVAASGDARFRELKPGFKVRPLMQEWLVSAWAKAIAKLPERTGTRDDDAKWKAALDALPKAKPKAGARDEAALLADVFARPNEDGPRLVYADFLQERGDPRGEFITLQCGARDEKRERALIKEHGKKWLGEIAPALGADVEFRRGFPAVGSTKFKAQRDAEKYGVLPDWATFEELEWREPGAASTNQRRWTRFIGPSFKHVKRAHHPFFTAMLEAKEPWAVERLTVGLSEPEDLQRFSQVAATLFPKLHTLEIDSGLNADWFRGVTKLGSVKTLIFSAHGAFEKLMLAASETGVDEVWSGSALKWRRDTQGKFTVLHFTVEEGVNQANFMGQALGLPMGFPTALHLEGKAPDNPKVVETLKDRVRREGQADPFAPKPVGAVPTLERWPPMTWLDEEHVLFAIDNAAFVVDAAKNRTVREFPIDRPLAVRRVDGGKAFLGLRNNELVCVDAQTGARRFELPIPWNSSYRLELSWDGKRAAFSKGGLVELETKTMVAPPRGAKDATYRSFDGSFWIQWVRDDGYQIRRVGTRDAVELEGQAFHELLEVPGALIARKHEALVRWDVTTGKITHSVAMKNELRPAIHTRLSEDGSLLAIAENDKRVLVLHTADLSPISSLDLDLPVRGVALSPSGKKLGVIAGNALQVFEVR